MISDSKNKKTDIGDIEFVAIRHDKYPNLFWKRFAARVRQSNPLHFSSAVSQLFLGFCTVYLSVTGHIEPLWLASLMSVAGSIASMLGIYLMYDLTRKKDEIDTLYKAAIKRVINSKN